ncbi:hypothetical protein LshimejAT787_2600050 [Lyophyllum shimeji]|uniref:YMC020W-like alpha/beta hydrolase domain-containing protein n=1 Tax=Lyophyllum shimeji TaxID=47721 RepID=A0A9P3UV04_LYOSH|nr:hypothetical protein LshimejAT787_2600050 [Lyophyllum shimeji]
MSSSGRSSRSVRSPKPGVWRTVSISKISAATSLTYVFAEPEQGSPLAPAASKLPAASSSRSITNINTAESSSRLCSRGSMSSLPGRGANDGESQGLESREHAVVTTRGSSSSSPQASTSTTPMPLAEPQQTSDAESTRTIGAPSIAVTTVDAGGNPSSIPFPSAERTTAKHSPRKSSWFGSLSRGKGKDKAAKIDLRAPTPSENTSTPTSPPTEPLSAASPASQPSATTVEAPAPQSASPTPPAASSEPSSTPVTPAPPPESPVPATQSAPSAQTPSIDISPPPPQTPPRRSWFYSSIQASPSSPAPRAEIPASQPPSSHSIPSSIDEEVPALSTVTPPTSLPASPSIVTSPSIQSQNEGGSGRARLSSLNPTTSRYTLSIPLFGRPKGPSEAPGDPAQPEEVKTEPQQAMTEAKASNAPSSPVPAIEVTASDPDPTPPTALPLASNVETSAPPPAPTLTTRSASLPPPSSSVSSPSPESHPTPIPSSSSWWSYVGWGTSTPASNATRSSAEMEAEKHVNPGPTTSAPGDDGAGALSAPPPSSVEGTAPSGVMTEASVTAAGTSKPDVEPPRDATLDKPPMEDTEGQPENADVVMDTTAAAAAETTSAMATSSSWYAPWTWYSSTGASNVATAPQSTTEVSEAAVEPGIGEVNGDLKLDGAGEVTTNMEATAKIEQGTTALAEARVEKDQEPKDVNPITATISTNRSGWASFFSSRALMMKTITDAPASGTRVDENGMEVMDVDEESDGEAEQETRGRDKGMAKAIGGEPKEAKKVPIEPKAKVFGEKKAVTSATSSRASSLKRPALDTPVAVNKGTKANAPPLTISEDVKRETIKSTNKKKDVAVTTGKKSASPSPSTKSAPTPRTAVPNLVLPTWSDTFHTAPRNVIPPPPTSKLTKTMKLVSGMLFATEKPEDRAARKGKAREQEFLHFGKELPKAWDMLQDKLDTDVLRGCRRVVVIGIHGWFPGAIMRTVLGEPTGTSLKFANMMCQALEEFQEQHGVKLEQITKIPLEGEGTIEGRVARLYANLQANQEWMDALHAADAVLIATHSQGSIVSTHLLDRLIRDRHIRTAGNTITESASESFPTTGLAAPVLQPQRVCCLALCGIHLGPLRYLNSSSLLQPYFQYFESAAARELFEFQTTESEVSRNYVTALRTVVDHGVKMVYVASLNDQVVPLYSGLFTAASHPLILRALYIDGDAYHSSDFLSNLLVLLLRILNSGISDSGLTVHLSEATAGSLSGVGHSTAYEELATYSLAVKYLFLTNNGLEDHHADLVLEHFNATAEQNDYEIPWALRDVIADERVAYFFSREIAELRNAFRDWHPKTSILRDLKRKLQPIQRLPASFTAPSSSKL